MTTPTAFCTRKPISWSLFASFVLAVCLILLNAACKPKLHLQSGQVHGFVVSEFANVAGAPVTQIALPDVFVYLKNTVSGKRSAKVRTNALGHFATNNERPGTYQVCAEASGFVAICDPKVISIVAGTVVLDHNLVINPEGGVAQGRVLFKDGHPCYEDNQHFGTYVTTKVSLHDGSGKLLNQPRTANNNGYYVLPQVPGAGTYQIEADCDGFKGSASFSGPQSNGGSPINVGLANSRPRITSVTATLSGTMVQQAAPGSTLTAQVHVYDPDGDTLHYRWGDGSQGFPTQDSPTIQWTLPAPPQMNFLWVEVNDGKGGYAREHVAISTAALRPVFGGIVVDRATGRAITGALVTINGARLITAENGTFQYTDRKDEINAAVTTLKQAPRYVINVHKPGYALLSHVVYSRTPQMKLMLDRAARTTCSPSSPCTASEQAPLITTHVQINANSLVDKNGNAASAPIHVDVHGYDITVPDPIPGDYAALDKNGKKVTMATYGAINVDLSDANGNTYNLAPGKTAQISIPVNTSFLGGQGPPPATLPLWSYNEQSGVWQEEATATYDPATHTYVGNVPHFSAWNADATFSNTACVFIGIDSATGPELPFQLQATVTASNNVRHPDFTVDSTDVPNFVFYRMIPGSQVQIDVYPVSGPHVSMFNFTVNAGTHIDPLYDAAPFNGIPPDPATECFGYDQALGPGHPPVISLTIPTGQTYLSLLGPNPAPSAALTNSYWQTVGALDASNNPITTPGGRGNFIVWKQTNGITQGPGGTNSAGEVEAIYFNNGDLQLGRDMHCLQTGSKVACYVTNYGTLQGPSQPAILDAEAKNNPVATVAMEYDPTLGSNAVRFYAFDNTATGKLFANPILDNQGHKFLPQNCMACHGGTYNTTTNNVDNASFLAFDIYSFLYDSTANPTYGTTPPGGVPAFGSVTVNQEQTFRQLNAMVLATNPNGVDATNLPISNLINGWYSTAAPPCNVANPVNVPGCIANDNYAPPPPAPGWSGHVPLYQTIPHVYCRTCHGSQGSGSTGFPDWTQYSDFNNPGFISFAACSATPIMPHAEVPFKKFWLSTNPSGPAYLADPVLGINIPGGCPR